MRAPLLLLFVKLDGRDVVVVGGGAMAAVRGRQLADAGARVKVVAPEIRAHLPGALVVGAAAALALSSSSPGVAGAAAAATRSA